MLRLNVLGLNCGTSVDAVDCALCEISQESPESPLMVALRSYSEVPLEKALRQRILDTCRQKSCSPAELCSLNTDIGAAFGHCARLFLRQHGIRTEDVDLIASHGQTIWHETDPSRKSTLQLGEANFIARICETTTVSDFRQAEVAAGRSGAPVLAFLDAAILSNPSTTRASQNIGGIGNVTIVPSARDGGIEQFQVFDTGPGNVLIDCAVRILSNGQLDYDKDGAMGAQGRVHQELVDEFLNMPYFSQPPPKSTGRELFSDDMAGDFVQHGLKNGLSANDIVATLTRVTAQSLVSAYSMYGPPGGIDELYICGGGSLNPNIISFLRESLPQTKVQSFDALGLPAIAREAVGFAILGFECILNRPVIIPKDAESHTHAVMGKITPAQDYLKLLGDVCEFYGSTKSHPLQKIVIKTS